MKYKNFQKEKEDWNLPKIIKGNASSYYKNNNYFNIQRDINNLIKNPGYNKINLNNFFSKKKTDNNVLNKNITNLKNNSNKSNENNNYETFFPNVFKSFEFKSNRNRPSKTLEKIINKNLIKNKPKTSKIQENLINQRNKIQSENINRNKNIIIDGRIFGPNFQDEGDIIIDYYTKKKFYLDYDKMMITSFQKIKDQLKIKEKKIIELNNKIRDYKNEIEQLYEKIDEINNTKEKDNKKEIEELQEKGRIEIEKIGSELNKYIDENNKIKKENEILQMKNKELEEEIKEIKLKHQSQEKVNNEEIMSIYKRVKLVN